MGDEGGYRLGGGHEPLWCGGLGFEQTQEQFARDKLPVMAVFNDAWSDKRLYPDDPAQRSVFQFLIPTRMAMDTLAQYAANDRGYKTAALVNDVVIDPRTENQSNVGRPLKIVETGTAVGEVF